MRIVAFVGAVLVSTALLVGAAIVLVFARPEFDGWLIVASTAVSFLVLGPLLLGSLYAYWGDQHTNGARKVLRGWLIAVVSAEAVSSAALFFWAFGTAAPLWIPTTFVGVAVALTVIAVLAGRALGRADEQPAAQAPPTQNFHTGVIPRAEVKRKITAVVITFVVAALVVGIGVSVLLSFLGAPLYHAVAFALQFGFLAAAMAAILATLPWNRALRDSTGRDLGRARTVGRVVLRGKNIALSPDDERAAARYAAIASVSLPFQLTYLVLLYAGLALGQVRNLVDGQASWFPVAMVVFLAIALFVFLPWLIVQIRRARRYARTHPVAPGDPAPLGVGELGPPPTPRVNPL
ncbi:hypothetical protein ACFXP7_10920 [Microbacterium sp. P06]|uniref:hypothetical protein n=1 Tax=Microbacterium sp. P06 TaxID=3366949 RepID=UPI003746C34F